MPGSGEWWTAMADNYVHLDVSAVEASWRDPDPMPNVNLPVWTILSSTKPVCPGALRGWPYEEWRRVVCQDDVTSSPGLRQTLPFTAVGPERGRFANLQGSAIVNSGPRMGGAPGAAIDPALDSLTKGGDPAVQGPSRQPGVRHQSYRGGAAGRSIHPGVIETDMGDQVFRLACARRRPPRSNIDKLEQGFLP